MGWRSSAGARAGSFRAVKHPEANTTTWMTNRCWGRRRTRKLPRLRQLRPCCHLQLQWQQARGAPAQVALPAAPSSRRSPPQPPRRAQAMAAERRQERATAAAAAARASEPASSRRRRRQWPRSRCDRSRRRLSCWGRQPRFWRALPSLAGAPRARAERSQQLLLLPLLLLLLLLERLLLLSHLH